MLIQEQIDAMKATAQPLVEWLQKNGDPHCKIIIENDSAEYVQGVAMVKYPVPD